MVKGKFGINLAAIATLAFVIGFFGWAEALILLIGYALLIEKDQWLTRQTFQALYLLLIYRIASTVVDWCFNIITDFFGWFNASRIINAFMNINNFVDFVLYIVVLLISILAIMKVFKGQDASIPLVSNLADFTMGTITKKTAPSPAAPPQYTPPAAPAAPVAPVQPAAEPKAPETPAAPGTWTCECGRQNTGNFCMGCGSPRQD